MSTRRIRLLAVFTLLPALAPAQASPLDRIVREDALLYVSVRDVTAVGPLLLGKAEILRQPAVRKALEAAEIAPEAIAKQIEDEIGVPLEDLLGVLTGPASLAVLPKAGGGLDDPDVLVALSVKEGERTRGIFSRLVRRIEEQLGERLARSREEDIRGTSVSVFQTRGAREGEEGESVLFALHGTTVLASSQRDGMARALAALDEPEASGVTGDPGFKAAMARIGPAQGIVMRIDVGALLKKAGEDEPEVPKILGGLGLDRARHLYVGLGADPAAFDMRLWVDIPRGPSGLLAALFPKMEQSVTLGHFADADVQGASAWQLDPGRVWKELKVFLDKAVPEAGMMVEQMVQQLQADMEVDLQKDILDNLQPPLEFVTSPAAGGAEPTQSPSVLIMRCKDPRRLEQILLKLDEEGLLESKEYLGWRVHLLEIPQLSGMGGPVPAFAFTDSQVFLSLSGTAPIERALRAIGKETAPLAGTEAYQRAMAGLPSGACLIQFGHFSDALVEVLQTVRMTLAYQQDTPEPLRVFLRELDPAFIKQTVDLLGVAGWSDDAGLGFAFRVTRPKPK